MSRWDKYEILPANGSSINKANRWDKYEVIENHPRTPTYLPLEDDALSVIGKSFNRGFASLADLPQTAFSLTEPIINAPGNLYSSITGAKQPYNFNFFSSLKPLSKSIEEGANYIGYDGLNKPVINENNLGKKLLSGASEGAGSFVGGGALGKGLKALGYARAANLFGSPSSSQELKSLAKTGASIGAGSKGLEEAGLDPISANLGASVAAPVIGGGSNLLKNFALRAKNPIINAAGLSKGKLNEQALTAANNLGIEIPTAAATDSKAIALADQYVGKSPYFGDKLAKKYNKAEEQTLKALEDLYENVGPKRTPETENKIRTLYENQAKLLPENASISAKTTLDSVDDILAKLDSPGLHKDGIELKNYLGRVKKDLSSYDPTKATIDGQSFTLPDSIKEQVGNSIPVKDLIGLKQNVNNTVQWDDLKGVKSLLAKFQKNVSDNIGEYGKTNPKWHENYRKADALFGKVAKRERLEELLSGKSINAATDNFSYNSLSKVIHNKKTSEELKKLVSKENYQKIQDLGEVARAMAQKNARVPNPSGTAPTNATTVALGTFFTGLFFSPLTTIKSSALGGAAGYGLTKLLTSEKFLDKALKIAKAKKPNMLDNMALNKEVKKATGMNIAALNNAFRKTQDQENEEKMDKQVPNKSLLKNLKKKDL